MENMSSDAAIAEISIYPAMIHYQQPRHSEVFEYRRVYLEYPQPQERIRVRNPFAVV